MSSQEKPEHTGIANYDDDVLDAGWVPQPETVVPDASAHPLRASRIASEDPESFMDSVYRSQGDGFD